MASKQLNNKALEKFAELMIEKIQQVSDNWQKPWITNTVGKPRNAITNRPYRGFNDLMLYFESERKGYAMPAYLTYKQAMDVGAHVKKGEKSSSVVYWLRDYVEKDNPKKKINADEYVKLSDAEKENYKQRLVLKDFAVFNVAQTSIPEEKPELYEKIKSRYSFVKLNDENGMVKSPPLDDMLENQLWLCAIECKQSNRAFYRPSEDLITVPLKAQFKDGESFYSTMLHEMAHSTGAESRLNRTKGLVFGDDKYAKEELVAELTAAVTAATLNISTSIKEENAQYLKSWLESLKTEPNFILTLLTDVNKASNMIVDVVSPEVEQAQSESVQFKPSSEKTEEINVFGLEKGKIYTFGGDNKQIQFTGAMAGGYLHFKYVDSGKTFQLLTNGKPPKGIKPFPTEDSDIHMEHENAGERKQLFAFNEIPKEDLKQIGVKMTDLSEVDKMKLLSGKETKAISVVTKGEKQKATLQLLRAEDNTVSLAIKVEQEAQKLKKGIRR